ncbi:Ribosomal RNA large subunit methyltransferase Cfr [Planctomycetes bacterium Pan216]|uniref:Ribosomal RNA large subunit methyltransferase Cfr n=1 Tax=Kolteria novifilia TaxID=2527975 RepID=A0A518B5Y3_9BACT|nr:Ribosomal RNA large subunit methyltransferase Cfr [Planctomycetes bacterium Pan216]
MTLPTTSIHDKSALERVRRHLRLDPQDLRRFRNALLKHQRDADAALAFLPERARDAFRGSVDIHPLELVRRLDSEVDGGSKLVFRTRAGLLVETVLLRIASGRTSVCVSSQVGCAAACSFCATGNMGIARDLPFDEVLDQVVQANLILSQEKRQVRNVVFMGMGEPFHNEANVHAAVEALVAPEAFALSPKHVVVSTVGIPDAMLRFAETMPDVQLALSLHSARQPVRESIIPLAKRHPLDELRDVIKQLNDRNVSRMLIEYLMLENVNDGPEDLDALINYLKGLDVHVNLIPYNPIAQAPGLAGSSEERTTDFANELKEKGFRVTVRRSLGGDIDAACGQLIQEGMADVIRLRTRANSCGDADD